MRLITLLLLTISLHTFAQVNANLSGKSLDQFFILASEAFQKTIIVDPAIDGKVKVFQVGYAANFRDVFFSVMRAHNLVYVESDTVIRVQSRKKLQPNNKIVTRTYKLNHVSASQIVEPLQKSLVVQSSVLDVPDITHVEGIIADSVLMVTAPQSMQTNIRELVNVIDTPLKQIRIKAVIYEFVWNGSEEQTVDLQAGFDALRTGFQGSLTGVTSAVSNFSSQSDHFDAFIRFLETNDQTKILSKPAISVLHGSTGFISVGQELPFITGQYTTDTDGVERPFQTIERKDVGLSLKVKPFIGVDGSVRLDIDQILSRVDKNIQASDIATRKRRITTTVNTKIGGSVMLAGMSSNEKQTLEMKVPLLGDVPVLGLLFTSESEKEVRRTLSVVLHITEV
ncbi:hypothetical protein DI392_08180 [Vibrio albus]|uniref:Type II secretory pathway protein n=1 Tax=Vibrio albus TaxID=2200953 RepID=A0A2U3BBP3_9VIBR|nr:hypothetical protein [Vibrio albus]PWI34155.1 hypothetical protein DI392_08180 [Vibrio albus]